MTVKLKQLECVMAVVSNGLSMTEAAKKLHMVQPGISRNIKNLENYLGFEIFTRKGKVITGVTLQGTQVVIFAQGVLLYSDSIKSLRAK